MDTVLFLTILVVVFALLFDFINGFHDTANAIATAVSTRALPPRVAVLMAATMNFIGAITFTGVAKALAKDIVDPFAIDNGVVIILAALLSAIIWNLVTWYYGIPSSSSHALIGSLAGAAIAAAGFAVLNYEGFIKIIKALIYSPFIAIVAGFIMMSIFKVVFKDLNLYRTNKGFRRLQIFTAAVQSFTHGTNDAQKSMGIITMALIAAGLQTGDDIPMWVRIAAATAMGLGTSIGGYKIIKTVGGKIMKIRPVNGAAADLASAAVIFGATQLHLPVSTTHVISSSIMGVGSAQRVKGVKWGVAKKIVLTWIITLPTSAIMGAAIFFVLNLFI
ncbi:inorganic phosphate transporter [Viridibacillus sp. FSL R5-0477]|uniref:Inorganic phosphate transporter n=1 Tax=Viridibacillus arenosi FSL R5-213 TaxID=1227360 RepID=W4EQT6_9BACL|nr:MULTISPECIES: inorganic phosphate transporter [Viridibacillus]ETT82940.1 inorganic phosphate transporter [Viridibacillus arenosi FSL R5-213]OMC82115.1 inorganic phosphate transporter [Viridibacillus sp. FSL H8-0123]OMC86272.1 inorganic phosphate transporter [Viridibacillus sp. FSL H7-0596]OMC90825.1 inorganic phosphate transporter [Viridibacillus arenosi]